ncbi:helix-turn-helix domain-containing protein [Pontibacter chinhatensis]|uniref:helix-turn-helix domain-containing protein n=1 Tax=Pontibacter chinhatensis TaxID=1436961 RepID=UPI00373FC6B4
MNPLRIYRFKLKPTKSQAQATAQWLGSCRYVYNPCLDYKKQLYTLHKLSISKNQMHRERSAIAKEAGRIGCMHSLYLAEGDPQALQTLRWLLPVGQGLAQFRQTQPLPLVLLQTGCKAAREYLQDAAAQNRKVTYRKLRTAQGAMKPPAWSSM